MKALSVLDGPCIRFTDPRGRQREVVLDPSAARVTIGRSVEAGIPLNWDIEVSRLHAALELVGTHWTLLDDGLSRNGTFVNGERLNGRHRLRSGDRIRLGATVLVFHEFSDAPDDVTVISSNKLPTARSLTDTQRAVLVALCRPFKHSAAFASPASNQQIANELFLTVDAIKTHMRTLFAKFGVEELPQNQKRVRLAELALQSGVISERDL